jgi:hypothetical protein
MKHLNDSSDHISIQPLREYQLTCELAKDQLLCYIAQFCAMEVRGWITPGSALLICKGGLRMS